MHPLRSRGWWPVLLVGAAASMAGLLGVGRGSDAEADRIDRLIRQFGARTFASREQASKDLVAIGEPALSALGTAAASADLEIHWRATHAIQAILLRAGQSKTLGMKLAAVAAGEFTMGSPKTEAGRRPDEAAHAVRITRPFLLGACEVTQDEYQQVMKTNPSAFQARGVNKAKVTGHDTRHFPVETVSWYDAVEFCNRLSKLDGYEPYYQLADVKYEETAIASAAVTIVGGNGYRLPTEAEWEFACRAGSGALFHFGDNTRSGIINCKPLRVAGAYGSSLKWPDLERPAVVSTHPANGLGLYEMHGNVAEWCWDWYDKDYYDRSPKDDPTGPEDGTHRVLRGGSWMISEGSCRSASRFFHLPSERKDYAGFRVARTPGPPVRRK